MARIDKYDPISGGHRAPLAANFLTPTNGTIGGTNPPVAVGLDASGRVVVGAGISGILGLLVTTRAMRAGDIVDVMHDGELVECGGVAGTPYFANTTTGAISAASGAGTTHIGTVAEVGRLLVHVTRGVTA